MTSIYNGQFMGNILIVGRTNCGKTTFIENEKLGLNNFFGNIVKTEWVSGIVIDKKREAEIQSYFKNETEVHIAQDQDKLDSLTDTFKQRSHENYDNSNVNSSFGENRKMDRLIIMDDVSGVADISKNFSNFLTVSRKFGYNCVYIFHVIIRSSQLWQKVISQTNIFNIFPASVPFNTVAKVIQSNCILQSKKYVPARSLWLNRVFSDLANSHEKHCLTIDCGYLNKNGPGRYRSSADNPEKQVCYFNKPGDDVFYNTFISERIKENEYSEDIYFKIEKVRGNSDRENFDAKRILEDSTSNLDQMEFSLLQSQSRVEQELSEQESKDLETLLKTFTEETEKQRNQNSSYNNNVVPKTEIKRKSDYSNTKVKARNLLTNAAYRRFKQSDFLKDSFIIHLLSFLLQNFNPINLVIKLELEKEREMVKFMWDVCLPREFVTFILQQNSFDIISQPNVTY